MSNPKPPSGPFVYDPASARYRGAEGRYVAAADVRDAVGAVVAGSARRMARLADGYIGGTLDILGLRDGIAAEIKAVHLALLAAGAGGWAALTPTDFGHVGHALRTEYAYLAGFMAAVAGGDQAPGGIAARARLYAEAGRVTYAAALGRAQTRAGRQSERNVLTTAEHCTGCLAESARGWVPLGTLVPIGARDCGSRDKCYMEYR